MLCQHEQAIVFVRPCPNDPDICELVIAEETEQKIYEISMGSAKRMMHVLVDYVA